MSGQGNRGNAPRAVLFGTSGPSLSDWERAFFRDADPLGFILFRRNVETPEQIRALTQALREAVGRADAPILIDQEGGRVQRLRPPHWPDLPPMGRHGALALADPEAAQRSVWLQARLIAETLLPLGLDVDCLPCVDLLHPQSHSVIGDRSFGSDAALVSALGQAACSGLRAGGVSPVVKHMPGHGRATVDSHLSLPRVETAREELARTDFVPFQALADEHWGMTAHIVYSDLDAERPATQSPRIIEEVIRQEIGFDGLLVSDDITMEALAGTQAERAAASLAAGCDLVLHCSGDRAEMQEVAGVVEAMTAPCQARFARASAAVRSPEPFDRDEGLDELGRLLKAAA